MAERLGTGLCFNGLTESTESTTPKHRAYRNAGLENTSCWYIQWIDSSKILGSYTDMKGTRSTDGGISWANMNEDTAGIFL